VPALHASELAAEVLTNPLHRMPPGDLLPALQELATPATILSATLHEARFPAKTPRRRRRAVNARRVGFKARAATTQRGTACPFSAEPCELGEVAEGYLHGDWAAHDRAAKDAKHWFMSVLCQCEESAWRRDQRT
jgi:hypothetical protein